MSPRGPEVRRVQSDKRSSPRPRSTHGCFQAWERQLHNIGLARALLEAPIASACTRLRSAQVRAEAAQSMHDTDVALAHQEHYAALRRAKIIARRRSLYDYKNPTWS